MKSHCPCAALAGWRGHGRDAKTPTPGPRAHYLGQNKNFRETRKSGKRCAARKCQLWELGEGTRLWPVGPQAASETGLKKGCVWTLGREGRGQDVRRQESSVNTPHSSEGSASGCWGTVKTVGWSCGRISGRRTDAALGDFPRWSPGNSSNSQRRLICQHLLAL